MASHAQQQDVVVDGSGEAEAPVSARAELKLRSYQHEMLEESLKRNVIVAMDTGSGKTHVAISRILIELERSEPTQLVWFMAPSVALCDQHSNTIRPYLSAYQVLSLTGRDGVDKWTDQRLWDAALFNMRVVVGTPKVLEDALTHGFVRMSRLALCIFDEAHRCIKASPMNTIMQHFYHPRKQRGQKVPGILGLSASPVLNADPGSLTTIEANLDAITITPKIHRTELERFVHPPEFTVVNYPTTTSDTYPYGSPLCHAVDQAAFENSCPGRLDVMPPLKHPDESLYRGVDIVKPKDRNDCAGQLQALNKRMVMLYEQLGPSAAEQYASACLKRYEDSPIDVSQILPDITNAERRHLISLFHSIRKSADQLPVTSPHVHTTPESGKAKVLIKILAEHASPSIRCIIFVEQRATVTAMARMLRSRPHLSADYKIGTFVGTSTSSNRKSNLLDFTNFKEQEQDLADFRNGTKNLMIATNVLEEGIDVSACNLIVCFDLPQNLVSFVQRRGRARQPGSKYILFIAESDSKTDPDKWRRLESEMKDAYLDDQRSLAQTEAETEDFSTARTYRIPATGALLTLDNAKAHLYHFCAVSTLRSSNYVDVRPQFFVGGGSAPETYRSLVDLPSFVHPHVRSASSSQEWKSETAATKDASFEAYVNLHKAGLVNDNLLPLVKDYGPDAEHQHIDQPSLISVSERMSPWTALSERVNDPATLWHSGTITLNCEDRLAQRIQLYLPTILLMEIDLTLYWNESTQYKVHISPTVAEPLFQDARVAERARRSTYNLLRSVHESRMLSDQHDFPVLFSSVPLPGLAMNGPVIAGFQSAGTVIANPDFDIETCGLVRVDGQRGALYILRRISGTGGDDPGFESKELIVTSFPKRKDFLHTVAERDGMNPRYTTERAVSIDQCTIDNMPRADAIAAALIPSIMHRIELQLLAQLLQSTVLTDVGITDTALIIEAISAPSADEVADYNRLEYLGDTILKVCAHLQVMAQHPTWPEGYLSVEKLRLVRNSTLSQAALDASLDQYILTKPFTGSKWRPVYAHLATAVTENSQREISSKTLADVVEALIGAALVDGGLPRAHKCIQTLLPRETWYPADDIFHRLTCDLGGCDHSSLGLLERLIGHTFTHRTLLVEAITHASFPYHTTGLSYERLEFLGDAVLDLVVVPKLFAHARTLRHWELHRAHEVLVNSHFLGYCCMTYGIEQDKFEVVKTAQGKFDARPSVQTVHLHDFIRAGHQLLAARQASLGAFATLQDAIGTRLARGGTYPWPELLALAPPKFFSDLVESVLGALYVDTAGNLAACERFTERLGVLPYLRRLLADGVDPTHPTERIGILANSDRVEYAPSHREVAEGRLEHACAVRIDGVEVAAVTGCRSRKEAQAKVACAAIRILENRGAQSSPAI